MILLRYQFLFALLFVCSFKTDNIHASARNRRLEDSKKREAEKQQRKENKLAIYQDAAQTMCSNYSPGISSKLQQAVALIEGYVTKFWFHHPYIKATQEGEPSSVNNNERAALVLSYSEQNKIRQTTIQALIDSESSRKNIAMKQAKLVTTYKVKRKTLKCYSDLHNSIKLLEKLKKDRSLLRKVQERLDTHLEAIQQQSLSPAACQAASSSSSSSSCVSLSTQQNSSSEITQAKRQHILTIHYRDGSVKKFVVGTEASK